MEEKDPRMKYIEDSSVMLEAKHDQRLEAAIQHGLSLVEAGRGRQYHELAGRIIDKMCGKAPDGEPVHLTGEEMTMLRNCFWIGYNHVSLAVGRRLIEACQDEEE